MILLSALKFQEIEISIDDSEDDAERVVAVPYFLQVLNQPCLVTFQIIAGDDSQYPLCGKLISEVERCLEVSCWRNLYKDILSIDQQNCLLHLS